MLIGFSVLSPCPADASAERLIEIFEHGDKEAAIKI
jgi:hypothetical protein